MERFSLRFERFYSLEGHAIPQVVCHNRGKVQSQISSCGFGSGQNATGKSYKVDEVAYVDAMKEYRGNGCIAPHILNLTTRWI
jgi:hypothetical protein